MKRYIRSNTQLPLGDYSTRSDERSIFKNSYYWQLRASTTDDLDEISYFAHSPEFYDRYDTAMNENTPVEILKELCRDPEEVIRETAQLQLDTLMRTGKRYWTNNVEPGSAYDYHAYTLGNDGIMVYIPDKSKQTPASSKPSTASIPSSDSDFDEDSIDDIIEQAYEAGFADIADKVEQQLGLYLDFSAVRGDYGTVFIFSDPDDENNADLWLGDPDAEITHIDYSTYTVNLVNDVLSKPKSKWRSRYKQYLLELTEM